MPFRHLRQPLQRTKCGSPHDPWHHTGAERPHRLNPGKPILLRQRQHEVRMRQNSPVRENINSPGNQQPGPDWKLHQPRRMKQYNLGKPGLVANYYPMRLVLARRLLMPDHLHPHRRDTARLCIADLHHFPPVDKIHRQMKQHVPNAIPAHQLRQQRGKPGPKPWQRRNGRAQGAKNLNTHGLTLGLTASIPQPSKDYRLRLSLKTGTND